MQNINNLCMGCMSETDGEQICSACGFDAEKYSYENALNLRSVLANRYVVGKVLAENGQGLTYLGFDTVSETAVHIHEYFPTGTCTRREDGEVEITNGFVYNEGIVQFIELYKKLGELNDLPVLFNVIDIFETNKTAYAVTEFLPGITLNEFLLRNGGTLSWEQARPLFMPMINPLRILHENGVIHGAISPETLIVGRDGKIRLNGFCINSVRNSGNEMVPEIYPGYAAVEQYDGEKLTPATDVYAFAASIFRTVTGNPPGESEQRRQQENLSFPKSVAEKMPRGVLIAMANALQINADDRTQTLAQFKEDVQSVEEDLELPENKVEAKKKKKAGKAASRKYTIIAALATILVLCIIFAIAFFAKNANEKETESSSSAFVTSTVSIGDIGNSSAPESKFSAPDFTGKTVASILAEDEYNKWFDFVVVRKEYNEKISKGRVCAQSVAVGTAVPKNTKIELVVSLGPQTVKVPKSIQGKTVTEATIELLKLGFEYDNIQFIEKKDTPTEKEVVISTMPEIGSKVNVDGTIIVYYNTNIKQETPAEEFTENAQ